MNAGKYVGMRNLISAFVLGSLVALTACAEEKKKPAAPLQAEPAAAAPAAVPAAPVPAVAKGPADEVKEVFATRCSTCHGVAGKGDGVAAAALNPKPRDITDKAWQKSVTDDHLKKVIVEGGAAVGKSPLMTANPDLKDKPAIVDGLVAIIRDLGK